MVRIVLLFLALLFSGCLLAQGQTDSLREKDLREVQIFGRTASRYAAGSRVVTIDSTFLRLNNSASLAEVLQYRTPVYIKSYGNGMLATAAFRGTSASQTAVLWQGFNISLPTLGQTDFSVIPVNSFKQIEVQSGSAGATYGTGAIGGTILLSSPVAFVPGVSLSAQQDFGSFGHSYTSLGGRYGNGKLNLSTNIYQNQSRNNFPFVNTTKAEQPIEKQENAATSQKGFTQEIDLQVNKQNTISFRGWYTTNDNQSQPGMAVANTHARLQYQNLRLMSAWEHNSTLGKTLAKVAFFNDQMHYQDDNTNSNAEVKTYQAQVEHNYVIQEKLDLKVGGEAQHFAGDVSGYAQPVSEYRAAFFGLLRYNPLTRLQLSLNVRQGLVAGYNPPLTPTVGFNLFLVDKLASSLALKGNVSRGYRVPTLNDRYWPTGNPDLKPENSWNYESGLQYKLKSKMLHLTTEATLFRLLVDNWIQWIPGYSGQWEPQNLKKVISQGLELSAGVTCNCDFLKIETGITYGFTQSQQQKSYLPSDEPLNRQLIYVPLHAGTAYSNIGYKTWLATANLNYTGYRFTTAENTRWLPAFTLLNLALSKTFTWNRYRFEAIGKVNNATNQVYQNMEYYAMPLRNYALSLRLYFNQSL